uniref:THAP-type domain-containing protein n=1 Tax=Heliothis virescens TaxID=7102 RepID=A0A2A4JUC7_HELVI
MYVTSKGIKRLRKTAVPNVVDMTPRDLGVIEILDNGGDTEVCCSSSMVNTEIEKKFKSPTTSLSTGSILDTPRKVRVKSELQKCRKRLLNKDKVIDNLRKKNTRLVKKTISLKNAVKVLTKRFKLDSNLSQDLDMYVKPTELFNLNCLNTVTKKKRCLKYPPVVRKFALTLHFYSTAAYRYLRKMYNTCLPHTNTIYSWYKSVEAKPGFTQESFDRLSEKVKMSNKILLCSLVVDEMSIRQQKIWTGKQYEGLVDIGIDSNDSNQIATQAYVFLLVSVNESWKIPIAYFFINSFTAENKSNLIKIALSKCHTVGIKVISLTFDGCKTNLSAMKLLGCNMDDAHNLKPFFKHPTADYDVFVFLDACHMIKLMRNLFESKKIIYNKDNNQIKWRLVEDLHKVQEKHKLHLANKLTQKHIWFKNSIMKVKLATQLLSRSVANAITFCDTELNIPNFTNSGPTTEFILVLNNLFDILNSRNFNCGGFKRPISSMTSNDVFRFFQTAKSYLLSLFVKVQRKRTVKKKGEKIVTFSEERVYVYNCQANTGVIGLLVCIESVQRLYTSYVETGYLRFIIAYKFSQDHVELFFGNIRSQGGFNNNPNSRQFKSAYKKLLMHLELSSKFTGNSVPLENVPILNCGTTVSNMNNTSIGYRYEIENEYLPDEDSSYETYQNNCDILSDSLNNSNSQYVCQIIGYIAGFVVRYILKKIKCDTCNDSVLARSKLWFHKLIDIKDFGGLCYASEDVYTVCKKTEEIIRREQRINSNKNTTKGYLCSLVLKHISHLNIFPGIDIHSRQQPALFNHKISLIKAIIEKFIDVRLHYIAKKTTEDLKCNSKRQLFNKLNLFQGN